MVTQCRAIAESKWFQNFILAVIVGAGVLVGLETSRSIMERHGDLIHLLDRVVLGVFTVEILIKMIAHGRRPWNYFKDPWNIFDFSIVAVCFLPFGGAYVAVLRMARLLRVLRLVTVLPRLQLLVGALLHSIPSLGYVGILLALHFYVYAVMGVFLFRDNDPVHFGNLGDALLTLFGVVTLEDWRDVLYMQYYGSAVYPYDTDALNETVRTPHATPLTAVLYFISFVLLGTMIMLNLFIGVIMNSMQETQNKMMEARARKSREDSGQSKTAQVAEVISQLEEIEGKLRDLKARLK
ncbi:ion transporter [Oscillatoria amoena NRMC-F 0135]|nr:ion transporter [Oscillatoria laete-virens]MDL5047535.1 ion transporter [Oscillatoria amoena NRMC-F 0135]MDL5054643.1 ion transporter [Oscillatoria laete-virens NRMC-F 0139]